MWITRHTLTSSLRSLPAKTAALAKTGHGCRLCAAVKPANPPEWFPAQRNRQRPVTSVTIWRSYTLVAPPGCNCRIASSAFRYGSGVTGVGDLVRAICCVSRYHAGCTADGIAEAVTPTRATATQHFLSARLRKRNLKNAFRLELPVQGRHMVIVDDVVTTGSTVAEIAQLLLRNGAATVQVWCLCRTL